ncbi:hypothetical protein ACTXT7_010246 [Hymenolepis weldensis]
MKLLPSVRDKVKVPNLTYFIESFMPKIVPERLVFESTVSKQHLPQPAPSSTASAKDIPKVVVFRNIIQFSSTLFEDFCRGLNISLLHSPSDLNGQDKQLVDYLKRRSLVSQEEETMEEMCSDVIP